MKIDGRHGECFIIDIGRIETFLHEGIGKINRYAKQRFGPSQPYIVKAFLIWLHRM